MFLVDTNVLSMAAPGRSESPAALTDWLDARSDELFLSTVTVAEISDGIAKLRRTGALARADRLDDWLDVVLHLYGDRVMPFDVPAARHAGLLIDQARATGQAPGFADLAIDAFHSLRKGAAAGVDGVTWEMYADGLEGRLADLCARLHRGAYRAPASRRVYIPKEDGGQRPLGIAALEDRRPPSPARAFSAI